MKAFVLGALAVALSLSCAGSVAADPPQCATMPQMLDQLWSKWGERPMFVGGVTETETVMLTAAPNGSNWTLLIIGPNGKACVGAAGPSWSPANPVQAGKEG